MRGDTSGDRLGQAAEWLVWTALTLRSPLHVFLPLRDMGVDGIVRIPGTDIAVALQVKSRDVLGDGKLHLLVRDSELRDPRVVIVAVVLDEERRALRPTAICIDVPDFVELAFRRGGDEHGYQASIPYPPGPSSRWHAHAVDLDRLATRLAPALADLAPDHLPPDDLLPAAPSTATGGVEAQLVGYRAEARLVALLARDPRLNVFKAFPDLEMVEYCARHVSTGAIAGLQVKAISVDAAHPRGTVKVPPHSYSATPGTFFVVLAERRDDLAACETSLLIPSMDVGDLLIEHAGELSFTWDPDSSRHDASVAPYRLPTSDLPTRLAATLE